MAKSVKKVLASVRMDGAIWASKNTAMLNGKTIKQIGQLVAAGIGYADELPGSTVKDIVKSAQITVRRRAEAMSPLGERAQNGLRIRRLSIHVKQLFLAMGREPPADLVALCVGRAEVPESPEQPKT